MSIHENCWTNFRAQLQTVWSTWRCRDFCHLRKSPSDPCREKRASRRPRNAPPDRKLPSCFCCGLKAASPSPQPAVSHPARFFTLAVRSEFTDRHRFALPAYHTGPRRSMDGTSTGPRSHNLPGAAEILHVRALDVSSDDPRVVRNARQVREDLRRRQRHRISFASGSTSSQLRVRISLHRQSVSTIIRSRPISVRGRTAGRPARCAALSARGSSPRLPDRTAISEHCSRISADLRCRDGLRCPLSTSIAAKSRIGPIDVPSAATLGIQHMARTE